jgi:hypothetical protein
MAMRARRRAYARLLVDRLDEILANARGHLLMDLEQLLAPLRFFLRRQRVDLDRAGRLDLGERFFILLFRDRVAIGSGLLHRGFELAADVRWQPLPELLVHDQGIADISVVGHREIFLHLVEFLRVDVGGRILAAIDDAGLKRLVDFRESQNLRQRAEAAVGRLEHL